MSAQNRQGGSRRIVAVEPGTPEYEALLTEARETVCDFDGHEWAEAGGGLLICVRCEDETWASEVNDGSA